MSPSIRQVLVALLLVSSSWQSATKGNTSGLVRNKRLDPITLTLLSVAGGAVGGIGITAASKDSTGSCVSDEHFGCHKGYCWAKCSGSGLFYEWCYTQPRRRTDYVRCTSKSQCNGCWPCAGSCTV
ncbi:Allergen Tha p 2 [Halotydeus destructor]|nr:Allergen Tha p 2 [Halotydeus destructor]